MASVRRKESPSFFWYVPVMVSEANSLNRFDNVMLNIEGGDVKLYEIDFDQLVYLAYLF